MIDNYENEIWRDVYFIENGIEYDFRGLYQVSSKGRVKSLINNHGQKREKILKTRKDKDGYGYISLCKNNKKNFKVHRLVAHIFLVNDNPIEKIEVNHKDENKTNNNVSNLEWCTRKYNCNYGTRNERHSEMMKGLQVGKNNPRARKIVSVDPITKQPVFIWQYKQQATDFYGISKEALNYYLKGKSKKGHLYNNFLWYYADEWEQMKESLI